MNIENIEAFVYVNHYGSFNKAAEVLFLSQPSVTARIQSLERELDCLLFDRLGKMIQLTDKGKQFLPYAQQIVQTFRKGKLQLQEKMSLPHELRIGSTVSVSNYLIPDLLPRLAAGFPELTFKLLTASTDELVKKLQEGEIDVAFVRKVVHPSFQSYLVYEDPIRLYVYKGHPFEKRGRVSIREIGQETLVFFECGSLDWLRVHRLFEHLELPPHIVYHADNSETAKKLVLRKSGICFLPGVCVRDEVRAGLLFPVDIEEATDITMQTNLITRIGEHGPVVEALLEANLSIV